MPCLKLSGEKEPTAQFWSLLGSLSVFLIELYLNEETTLETDFSQLIIEKYALYAHVNNSSSASRLKQPRGYNLNSL